MRRGSQGFTLMEMMFTVVLMGILIVIVTPMVSQSLAFMETARRSEHALDNRRIVGAMLEFARIHNNGRLPAPVAVTAAGVRQTVVDVSTSPAAYVDALRNTGIALDRVNHDGAVLPNARVYQRTSHSIVVPAFITSGTDVQLAYDVGVVYMSRCQDNNSCTNALPGHSPTMTTANANTWAAVLPDYAVVGFSTLPIQREMLNATIARLNRLADRIQSEFHARMRLAPANSTVNFFPTGTGGAVGVASLGCRVQWIRLDASTVLDSIGLNRAEYATTAWGGSVFYCRDYNPSGGAAGTAPHYAALAIDRRVSVATTGLPTAGNMITITF